MAQAGEYNSQGGHSPRELPGGCLPSALSHFSWITDLVPVFGVNGSQIHIIKEPDDFYQTLKVYTLKFIYPHLFLPIPGQMYVRLLCLSLMVHCIIPATSPTRQEEDCPGISVFRHWTTGEGTGKVYDLHMYQYIVSY